MTQYRMSLGGTTTVCGCLHLTRLRLPVSIMPRTRTCARMIRTAVSTASRLLAAGGVPDGVEQGVEPLDLQRPVEGNALDLLLFERLLHHAMDGAAVLVSPARQRSAARSGPPKSAPAPGPALSRPHSTAPCAPVTDEAQVCGGWLCCRVVGGRRHDTHLDATGGTKSAGRLLVGVLPGGFGPDARWRLYTPV